MTTDNFDPLKSALGNILESFRNGTKLGGEDKRPTVAQDHVRSIVNSGKEYAVIRSELEAERESLTDRIAYNDSLTGEADTLEVLQNTFDMMKATSLIELELLKPEPFYGETILEIDVPSGKLVIADSLGPVFYPESVSSINYGRGQHEMALKYAEDYNVASACVGNSCPTITQQTAGSYMVVSLDLDEEDNPAFENGEKEVAHVVTDSWSVELTDYQNWLDNGGEELPEGASHRYTLLSVTPGKYRWTVKCHAEGWDHADFDRAEFATLELVEAY
jgi:hypothetical protein